MNDKKLKQSPNPKIDEAFDKLLTDLPNSTLDAVDQAKVLHAAVNWEKVKHQIVEDNPFDPDSILGDD